MDLCDSGVSVCTESFANDAKGQVQAVMSWARDTVGAKRVVLAGASMGGSIALGVGQDVGADTVIDLSGPTDWTGVPEAVAAAKATTVPLLIASAKRDLSTVPSELKAALTASPSASKRFLSAPEGHGYELLGEADGTTLTPSAIAKDVLAWIEGHYEG